MVFGNQEAILPIGDATIRGAGEVPYRGAAFTVSVRMSKRSVLLT